MTVRDYRSIHTLYYFHRYIPSSIARLYGVAPKTIMDILEEYIKETVVAESECQICSNDDAENYYIDGDEENKKPQNIIMLCEPDKRKFEHMQLRRKRGTLIPQL